MEGIKNIELEPLIETEFLYVLENEVNLVKYLCSKYDWYIENRYKPIYPKSIQKKLENGEPIAEEDIELAVSEEFDVETGEKQMKILEEEWGRICGEFFKNLKTLELPLSDKYYVSITKYGNGGGYGTPSSVQLRFEQPRSVTHTLAHEIVHLTIEHLIKKYQIDHWTKERIVDLVMNKFFPDNQRLQRNPENVEKVSEIFEREFPDIEKIIAEISKL